MNTTAELEAKYDALENHECDYSDECSYCHRMLVIERELDARSLWDSDDDRVRESVGNYR